MEKKRNPYLVVGLSAENRGLTLHLMSGFRLAWVPCTGADRLEVRCVEGEFKVRCKPGEKLLFNGYPDVEPEDPNWPDPANPLALPDLVHDPDDLPMKLEDGYQTLALPKVGWSAAVASPGMVYAAFLVLDGLDDPRFSVLSNWFGRELYGFWPA